MSFRKVEAPGASATRNNEPATKAAEKTPLNPSNGGVDHMFGAYGLVWDGNVLRRGKRVLISIEADAAYPGMWRVRLPSGRLTDMLNRTRAKDFACAAALRLLGLSGVSQ